MALKQVVAAPYLVALNVNLHNGASMLIRSVTQLGILALAKLRLNLQKNVTCFAQG